MRVAVFSCKDYTEKSFRDKNVSYGHEFLFLEERLEPVTAYLAQGCQAVCVFVNDRVDAETLDQLRSYGVNIVALRCAGFNNVDLQAADHLSIKVVRVSAYSPYAVAEHAIALMLGLNRKTHKAHSRIREGNFSLDGLLGFDMHDHPVGIIGTGKIGAIVAKILTGFGCKLMAYDVHPNRDVQALGVEYVSLDDIYRRSYVISLHCPLTPQTYHMINDEAVAKMQECVMLINTSRGALVDTVAVIDGLKSGKIGYLGLDVYEEEADLFFQDFTGQVIQDDVFARLLMFPNVLVTGHQGFFTTDAINAIAETTLRNIDQIEKHIECPNRVMPGLVVH